MGKVVSIDLSLSNIWASWYRFVNGKKASYELLEFFYNLESNLFNLREDLVGGTYAHRFYRKFFVTDNKRREVSVACLRDRVVHRLIYDYLVPIYDDTFIFDVWSCRKNKGLLEAIERTQKILFGYSSYFVWRADIIKFFDNVSHKELKTVIERKIKDSQALSIINKIIDSYAKLSPLERERETTCPRERGCQSVILPVKFLLIFI